MTDLIQALTQQSNSYEKGNFKHGSLRGPQTSAQGREARVILTLGSRAAAVVRSDYKTSATY